MMGDQIRSSAGDENRQVAQGKDIQQISLYTDSITWREAVRESHYELRQQINDLRGWARGLMIAIAVLFLLGFVLSAFAIRQFDITDAKIFYNSRRIDAIERREDRRLPSGVPGGEMP